ncbi:probable UDP-3-O-acylglucosamine N-acyltransferase 2, mitochondrial isoform X3 [Actinidia eriantha]|uniref:probable UDP-3-O-acylglucosamine N-acyltransferase 2, mitochondrial isoform X3 n=1 Tax=Actinidia eriantha TaxID=165200 RepID=UPI002589E1A9|nr:probable UDP-3-O-acylglucosamine N-acyltransferase 2, mitochondrial isoform X3 [Actinidia eriantha]
MAQNLRRLASFACEKPHGLFTRRPISHSLNRRHFSVSSAAESASKVGSVTPEDHQGFEKWHNGGGSFHSTACVDETAVIETGAVVHPKAVIGPNTYIGSGAIIGPAVSVGQSTKLGYNVALSNCTIGDYCVIHNGVCIGQDGFGFFLDEHGDMVKKPQILKALIGHHVEIGANTCIDRGSWRDTSIGDHTKIDNLVQIGHNVVIGKYCMLCGQVGIAGMGGYVTLGGRVAVRDHVSIVSKVRLAANSSVTKGINEPGDYGGFPASPEPTSNSHTHFHFLSKIFDPSGFVHRNEDSSCGRG